MFIKDVFYIRTSLHCHIRNSPSLIIPYPDVERFIVSTLNAFEATKNKQLDRLKLLVDDQHFNIYVKDSRRQTVAHWVAARGRLDVVKYLIDVQHFNIYVKDDGGYTFGDIPGTFRNCKVSCR